MGHFKEELTEIELFIEENFSYNTDEDNKFTVEDEGEFVEIKPPTQVEEKDGDKLLTQ